MPEYINKQELLDKVKSSQGKTFGDALIVAEIENADGVDIVFCKDCKKFIKKGEEFLNNDIFGVCEKSRTGFFDDGEEVYGNDFCSYGERKEK